MQDQRRFLAILAVIAVGGVAIRVWLTLTTYDDLPLRFSDNYFYHRQANLLAQGRGFIDPFRLRDGFVAQTAAHPPVTALYLSGFSLLGFDSITAHRLATTLFAIPAVFFIGDTGRLLRGPVAGVIAATLTAVHPALWINDGLLLSESPYVPLVGFVLWSSYRYWLTPTFARASVAGLAVGLTILTRSEAQLLVPLLVLPLAWRAFRRVGPAVAIGGIAVCGAVLAPWVIRNLTTFDEPTTVAIGAGYVMELANCDETYNGDLVGFWSFDCEPDEPWPPGDETVVGAAKQEHASRYIRDHLGDQPRILAIRLGRTFGFFRPSQTIDLDTFFERHERTHLWWSMTVHWAILPFVIWGLVDLRRRHLTMLPPLAITATVLFSSAVSFGIFRYRVGFDVVAALMAGIGIAALVDRRPPLAGSTATDPDLTLVGAPQ